MQNLNTVHPKPMATLYDYFNEPAIAEQLESACDDSNLIDEMLERIQVASMAKGWDDQKSELVYVIGEMQSLINTVTMLINKSPEWPVSIYTIKKYALAIGKANEYQFSTMTAARQIAGEDYVDES